MKPLTENEMAKGYGPQAQPGSNQYRIQEYAAQVRAEVANENPSPREVMDEEFNQLAEAIVKRLTTDVLRADLALLEPRDVHAHLRTVLSAEIARWFKG